MDLAALMLCVALQMGVEPVPVPTIEVRILKRHLVGRYLWQENVVQVRSLEDRTTIAHEFAHVLQWHHGRVELNKAGYPVWRRSDEYQAGAAARACTVRG